MNPYDYTNINDLQEYMRLMNLGGQMQQSGSDPSSVQPYDVNQRLQQLYHPESSAQDRYNQLLNQFPQREHPSRLRQIGSALAGLSAVSPGAYTDSGQAIGIKVDPAKQLQIQDQFLNRPYYQRMDDFQARLKPTQESAELERGSNTNKRIMAEQTIGREIQDRRADIADRVASDRAHAATIEAARKQKKDEADVYKSNEDRKIREARAKAYIFKQTHPNHIIKETDKGELLAINPGDGSTFILADDDGNPIKSSKMTDSDRINLQIQGRMNAIAASGAESRKTEEVKAGNRQEDIAARGNQARTTKTTPAPARAPTQTDVTIRDAKGNVQGSKTTTSGPKQARVRVKGPNGEIGTVSMEDAQKLPKGWEVVK